MTAKRKKVLKRIGYSFLIIILLFIIAAFVGIQKFNNALFKERINYLSYTFESTPIHFDWAINKKGEYIEKQAAMIVPAKIENIPLNFHMQFDTGAPDSYIYENDLKSLQAMGLHLKEVEKDEERYVESLEVVLGGNHMKITMLKVLQGYGHKFDENDTISRIGIGTIGSDFLENRVTEIDFKNQKIALFKERPEYMQSMSGFTSFDFKGRRIMLPVTLNKKNYEFLYDSGCSAFGLITIKSRFNVYTDANVEEIKYDAKSWDSSLPIRSKLTEQLFAIGSQNLSLKRVSYIDMYTAMQPLMTPFTRIGGWLGNQPFNESTLILDTQKEEFIVLKN